MSAIEDTIQRFVRRATPAAGDADRTLLIVHGTGEHSGRYGHLLPHIVARGWNVVAGDLRGHGLTTGTATHLDDFEQYLDDIDAICDHFRLDPGRTAMFGHSLGGLVSLRFAQTRPDRIAALALSAPLLALGLRVPLSRLILGRVCSVVAPRTRFQTRVPLADITRNTEALARRCQDPLTNRTVTAGWYFCVLDALRQASADAGALRVPLLIMQGDADRIVRPEGAVRCFVEAGSPDKSLWMIRDHLHELLNEPGWEATLMRLLDWLEIRVPAGSHPVAPEQNPQAAAIDGSAVSESAVALLL